MAEILSQQEIDSLLSGIGGAEEVATPTAESQAREVVRFDFRLPHRLSKRQLQTFHAIHDSFAEAFSSFLIGRLQTNVTMSVVSVDQIFYSEYVLSIGKPSCLYVFRLGHNEAMAAMEMSPSLVLAIIARMLGGTSEGKVQSRLITKIEQNIIKNIAARAIADLEKAWSNILESKFKLERYETEGDFIQIAPTSEIVLVVSFELSLGEQKYLMNVCFPTFALEDTFAKLNAQKFGSVVRTKEHNEWAEAILKKISTTQIPAKCILGDTKLTLEQLMHLEPGDVLMTNTPIAGELKVIIGGKHRANGRPGISNGKKAVKITHMQEVNKASKHDG